MDDLSLFLQRSNLALFSDRFEREEDPQRRVQLRTLMVDEERRYGFRLEQLDLANDRIGKARQRVERQRALVSRLTEVGDSSATRAEATLRRFSELVSLFEQFRTMIEAGINRTEL